MNTTGQPHGDLRRRTRGLPAGNYTIIPGSNAPATDPARRGYPAKLTTIPAVLAGLTAASLIHRRCQSLCLSHSPDYANNSSVKHRILLTLTFAATSASAHHGRDFLLVQDYLVPAPSTGILFGNFEFSSQDGPDEWSVEPGLMYGLAPRLAFGLTADFADEGEGWKYRSISPQFQFQLTDAAANMPIRFALVAGYQFADGGNAGDEPPAEGRIALRHEGHDEELEHALHGHGGIHQHDSDAFFARLIMETDLTPNDKLVVNILSISPDDGETAFGYAAGWRHSFNHDFALGLEATGDFDNDGSHEAVAAGYFSLNHSLTLKLGIGAGLTDVSPDFTIRSGVTWRF